MTLVPDFTQKAWFLFALGITGVEEAESEVRLISTVHGVEDDPQVFSAVQMACGLGSEQRYFSLPRCCSWATEKQEKRSNIASGAIVEAKMHRVFMRWLPPS
jgi:hypothetical protein